MLAATHLRAKIGRKVVGAALYSSSTGGEGKELGVLIWGEGKNGRLGLGNTSSELWPTEIENGTFGDESIRTIHCGSKTSAAITESGRLYTWGSGKYGLLGHGNEEDITTPKEVTFFKGVAVRDIKMGSLASFVVTEDDKVFSWGYGSMFSSGCLAQGDWSAYEMPTEVKFFSDLGKKVEQISIGQAHAYALVEGGQVYAWGKGDYGRLGLGSSRDLHTPMEIPHFSFEPAHDISAGAAFGSAITENGVAYSWGGNDSLQLGIGPSPMLDVQSMEADPRGIRGMEADDVALRVSNGQKHGILCTEEGKVYEWGVHRSAVARLVEQLDDTYGVASDEEKLTDFKAVQVSSGNNYSAVVMESGELFTWGGTTKALGVGESAW
eukprot:CAMPEP_0167741974 /NCGR_PEP_ID=MMETSP0110_2-20121227/1159_1 /TAXON_ID=629695 /ORGANISM="Gymnochlora sp., Strain CCMP2014" /LENGTH=379 /DNA_ID=CAMNT_0007626095 /DNA_START=1741 /DNA_END=2877 /DNA_ORIENTATION=-